jgi:hypothetical protein
VKQPPPLLLVQNPDKRRGLAQFASARAIRTDRLRDPFDWQLENALPLSRPPRVEPAALTLAPQAPASVVDDLLIKSLTHESVVRKALKLGYSMRTRPLARKKPVEVDGLRRPATPVANHSRKGPPNTIRTGAFDVLEQLHDLGERDLAPAVWRNDRGDVPAPDPPVERRLTDTKQPRSFSTADRWSGDGLEKFANRPQLAPERRIGCPLGAPKPKDLLDCLAGVLTSEGHEATVAESSELRLFLSTY